MSAEIIRERMAVLDKLVDLPGQTSEPILDVLLFDENSMDTGVGVFVDTISVLHLMPLEFVGMGLDGPKTAQLLLVRYICATSGERGLGYLDLYVGPNTPNPGLQMFCSGELARMLTDEQYKQLAAMQKELEMV
jgi:hypothetical protein